MGLGDSATKALEMAHNAYKASIEVGVTVKALGVEVERQDRRTKEELLAQERRLVDKLTEFDRKLNDSEGRVRKLEGENAELRGKLASLEHLRELEAKHASLQGQITALEHRMNSLVLEAMKAVLRDSEHKLRIEEKSPGDGPGADGIAFHAMTK